MNSTTSTPPTKQHYDAATVRAALRLHEAAEERARLYPHLAAIGQLATVAALALETIDELTELAAGKDGPIDAGDGLDASGQDLTYAEFREESAGWRWAFGRALFVLRDHFSEHVEEALANAGLLDEDDAAAVQTRVRARLLTDIAEADDGEPAAVPAIAELPAARSQPYWLA